MPAVPPRTCVLTWWLCTPRRTMRCAKKQWQIRVCYYSHIHTQRYLSHFNGKISEIFSFVYLFCVLLTHRTNDSKQQQHQLQLPPSYHYYDNDDGSKIWQMNWSNANCKRIVEVYDNKCIPHLYAHKKCECDEKIVNKRTNPKPKP